MEEKDEEVLKALDRELTVHAQIVCHISAMIMQFGEITLDGSNCAEGCSCIMDGLEKIVYEAADKITAIKLEGE